MKNILPKVRIDENGNELEEYNEITLCDEHGEYVEKVKNKPYNQAKEVYKLIPLSEFIKRLGKTICISGDLSPSETALMVIHEYTDLITQPLTKGQFVPCDLEGNVLVEPTPNHAICIIDDCSCDKCELDIQYYQAEDRVLFEGWEMTINVHGMTMFEKDGFGITIDNDKQLPTTINTGRSLELCNTIEAAINAGVVLYMKIK